MEILAELIFGLLGILLEGLLGVVFEILAGFGVRALGAPFKPAREVSPWLAALGYAVYGAAAGGLSLWPFPAPYLEATWLRIANLAVSPLLAGAVMSLLGAWRRKHGQSVLRLDRFSYGVLFALAFALVRYVFAEAQ